MRRRSLVLPFLVALAASCDAASGSPRVSVVTDLTAPRALLDKVTKLSITVLEGDATCDPQTGAVTKGATATAIVTDKALASAGCANGAKFCGDIAIDQSDAPRVFSATGTDGSGATIATGCTTATANASTLAVSIKMVRYLAPAVCGDGTIEPTEQCEPGGTPLCDTTCQTNEILLSAGSTQNKTTSGSPGDKTNPSLLWPSGTGTAGWFYAFYTDRATGAANNSDIGMRVMDADLGPLASPPAPVAFATASLFLPNGSNGGVLPPSPEPYNQAKPAAALLANRVWIAFQDENAPSLDVHLRSMDPRGVADQGAGAPIGVNGGNTGEPGVQGAPAIAAGASSLFVAWEDQAQGKISGRTVTPPSTLGNQNDLSTGSGNSHVSLAKVGNGWVAVWQGATGIKLRAISADGTPSGGEQTVSEAAGAATSPSVAALPDGSFAVAWSANDDVFVQRYDAQGAKIPGDQTAPVNDLVTDGTQRSPAIAALPSGYAVAWLDEGTGHVRARFLGATSGFLFNNVTGQSSEFQASRADGRTRDNPAITVGGAGPHVAIAWEDKTQGGSGVVARRFPVPTP